MSGKPIFSKDHAEVIGAIWNGMDDEAHATIYRAVSIPMGGVPAEGEGPRDLAYTDVVRVAWCLGFHYAMCAMEQGALVKLGKPERN
jgi:hypothetical protein